MTLTLVMTKVMTTFMRPREGAENWGVLLSVRYGTLGLCTRSKRSEAFSEAFLHSNSELPKNDKMRPR